MKKVLGYFLVFVFLFLMNIFIFKILATLGFQLTMSEKSYIVPPLFSIIVLYMIDKRIRKKKNKYIFQVGRLFYLFFIQKVHLGGRQAHLGRKSSFCLGIGVRQLLSDEFILFENQIQTTSTSPCRIYVTDFVSPIYNLKTVF